MFCIEWWEQTLMEGHGQRAGQMERWPALPYPGLEVQLRHVGYQDTWCRYRVVKVHVVNRTGEEDVCVMVQVEAVESVGEVDPFMVQQRNLAADDFPRLQLRDEELPF